MMRREQVLFSVFNLLYTRFAWAYDMVAWVVSAGQWYNWVETALPFIEAGPVLEVGCGRGRLLDSIAKLGYSVTGVDYTIEMAQHARQTSQQPVIRGDGRQLPFKDGHFSTLITTFPAPYVLHAQTQQEFARVVQPGGLWLWVDGPMLEPVAITTVARLITRAAYGHVERDHAFPVLAAEETTDLWQLTVTRVAVGYTSIAVQIARRSDVWEQFTT